MGASARRTFRWLRVRGAGVVRSLRSRFSGFPVFQGGAYNLLRIVLGLLLLTAAGLKAHQLATQPVLGAGFLNSRWFVIAVVEFEVLFGLWLLAGLAPRCSWRCAVLLFSAFAAVSAHKALRGDVACGCFGRVQVNPWQTLALDVGVVLALLRWQPVEDSPASARRTRRSPRS